jgi:hypothetical protein
MKPRDLNLDDTGFRGRNNGGHLADRAGKLLDEGAELADEAEGMFQRYKHRAIDGAKAVDTRVRGFADDHPLVTLFMAVGLGYGLGYLIYRRAKAA